MIFRDREVLERLAAIERRLGLLEAALHGDEAPRLRAALDAKERQLDALGRQGLRVAELLAEARAELARLRQQGGS